MAIVVGREKKNLEKIAFSTSRLRRQLQTFCKWWTKQYKTCKKGANVLLWRSEPKIKSRSSYHQHILKLIIPLSYVITSQSSNNKNLIPPIFDNVIFKYDFCYYCKLVFSIIIIRLAFLIHENMPIFQFQKNQTF